MTIGITFLIIFLPIIAFFIAQNFVTVYNYFIGALDYIASVSSVGVGLYNALPSYITDLIIAILILYLTYALLRRIIS